MLIHNYYTIILKTKLSKNQGCMISRQVFNVLLSFLVMGIYYLGLKVMSRLFGSCLEACHVLGQLISKRVVHCSEALHCKTGLFQWGQIIHKLEVPLTPDVLKIGINCQCSDTMYADNNSLVFLKVDYDQHSTAFCKVYKMLKTKTGKLHLLSCKEIENLLKRLKTCSKLWIWLCHRIVS